MLLLFGMVLPPFLNCLGLAYYRKYDFLLFSPLSSGLMASSLGRDCVRFSFWLRYIFHDATNAGYYCNIIV